MRQSTQTNLDQIEKKAIIALQAILNCREPVSVEKYDRFSFFIDKLPPHRALVVFGHTVNAVADRMSDEDPHKLSLKRMARTITEDMGSDYIDLLESDPAFFRQQSDLLAGNLCDISDIMRKISEKRRVING